MDKDHEAQRKKLWCDVYVAYVGAANSTNINGAKVWADVALRNFDEKFPKPQKEED